ncbi:MAG TPA: hypothetical protein VMC07_02995 [Candidatus Omnitrophota bacterium]|nr:hypothetical protein [Candidatus Omnitrophota bacterium]
MENAGNRCYAKAVLASAVHEYALKDKYAIKSLGIAGEKYDGSPVDRVFVWAREGNLIVSLMNDEGLTKNSVHNVTVRKRPRDSAWELTKQENKEKVIRLVGADFLLDGK